MKNRNSILYLAIAGITALLVLYSQTRAFAWDEGFHVLAAQSILHGKRPYLDFCFSQTPLNAYWNALLLRIFGESWRPLHAVAAICTGAAVWLMAAFVRDRFPVVTWRLAGAVTTAFLIGGNIAVVRFGGLAQAYGICLLAISTAFRFSVIAVRRRGVAVSALAGLACGIAAGCSLLTAPVIPILFVWMLRYNRNGSRAAKSSAFIGGVIFALLPVLWLFVQGPRQVYFGIVEYNSSYRLLNWPGATEHNLEVYAAWIDSGPVLLLILLAIAGWLFVHFRSNWEPALKAEFALCAWLAAGLAAYLSYGKPTFERYYLFTVPFLAVLAVAGLYAIGTQLYKPGRPWMPALVLFVLAAFGLAKDLIEVRNDIDWPDLEKVARAVREITPPQETLYADEAIYFLTRHAPPSGLEMDDSHKFSFTPNREALLHVISAAELRAQVKAGKFDVTQTCEDDEYIADHGFANVYARSTKADFCTIFWGKRTP